MTQRQAQELAKDPLFSIGMHTHTHPALASLPADRQKEEISGNQKTLSIEWALKPFGLAYPYGIFNQASEDVVNELKIAVAVTVNATAVRRGDSPIALGRFQVPNLDRKQFSKWLDVRFRF